MNEGKMTIKELRGKRGVSQQELADLIGKTRPAYANKENGLTEFTLKEARAICKHLNFPLEDLVD